KAVLVNPLLARLGVLSYSIYLIHFPLITHAMPVIRGRFGLTVWRWEPRAALVLACVAVPCLALSTLTYRFIERPFLERKSRRARLPAAADRGDELEPDQCRRGERRDPPRPPRHARRRLLGGTLPRAGRRPAPRRQRAGVRQLRPPPAGRGRGRLLRAVQGG